MNTSFVKTFNQFGTWRLYSSHLTFLSFQSLVFNQETEQTGMMNSSPSTSTVLKIPLTSSSSLYKKVRLRSERMMLKDGDRISKSICDLYFIQNDYPNTLESTRVNLLDVADTAITWKMLMTSCPQVDARSFCTVIRSS